MTRSRSSSPSLSVTTAGCGPGRKRDHQASFPGEVFRPDQRIAGIPRKQPPRLGSKLPGRSRGAAEPGMFIATITLVTWTTRSRFRNRHHPAAARVDGVFLVGESGDSVRWVPVETGIWSGGWVELKRPSLSGRVVTLGQHLIDDGSPIRAVTAADQMRQSALMNPPGCSSCLVGRRLHQQGNAYRRRVGYASLIRLKVDLFPASNCRTVSIRVGYPVASPEVVEAQVTQIIEEIVLTAPVVEEITSRCS